MRDYIFTLAANSSDHKAVGGNFIKVNTAGVDVRVIAEDAGGRVLADIGMSGGTWIKLPDRFETVRVENTTGSVVTVSVTMGVGEVDDSELTGVVALTGTVDIASAGATIANSAHTVGVAAAVLLAANTARRSLVVLNSSVNDIFIGDSGVTVLSGFKVAAGQAVTLDKSAGAALYAIAGDSGLDVRILQELN